MNPALQYQIITPDKSIIDYVESFWMLQNPTQESKEVIILPDGRIDLFCEQSTEKPFHITLSGLETQADAAVLAPNTILFAISFKLLAVEYLFQQSIAPLINAITYLPHNFWDMDVSILNNFEQFCNTATQKIKSLIPASIDNRKKELFDLLYNTSDQYNVQYLADKVFWSSRQINRYFNQQFGLSLKTYLGILRFRAAFPDIRFGKLYPQQNYSDQSHFIKAVKQLSGVVPKALQRNQNDRFIQFSMLSQF